MRWKTTAAIAACVLLIGKAASTHRIDEYLQATVLSVEANRVQASMRPILSDGYSSEFSMSRLVDMIVNTFSWHALWIAIADR
jgi:hypothetical protein